MNKVILLVFLFFAFVLNAQNDTIRIQKNQHSIYKCQNVNALSWYIQVSNNECILADLKINTKDIERWFKRFGNSQNIYRASFHRNESKNLFFKKANEPLDTLFFKIIVFNDKMIKLEIHPSGELYEFVNFE